MCSRLLRIVSAVWCD
ncbi:hypothetical protein ACKKLS_004424 [Escherichia albertii]